MNVREEQFSLRLGHARALTPHCGVIQDPRAASLPLPYQRWAPAAFLVGGDAMTSRTSPPREGGGCPKGRRGEFALSRFTPPASHSFGTPLARGALHVGAFLTFSCALAFFRKIVYNIRREAHFGRRRLHPCRILYVTRSRARQKNVMFAAPPRAAHISPVGQKTARNRWGKSVLFSGAYLS